MTDRGAIVRGPWAQDDWQSLSPFRPLYASDIDAAPAPPHWLCDGILLPGTVTLFAGAPKTGKSLVTLQMLIAMALGLEWMGRATEQARTLAIFCEDKIDQVQSRILAICEHYAVHQSVLEREFSYDCRPHLDYLLWETEFGKGKPTLFWEQIFGGPTLGYANCEMATENHRVLLLDTAAAMFAINHNNTGQVSAAMAALRRQAIRYDCAIIVNIHSSRGNKESFGGSTQWEGGGRGSFNIARPKPPPGVDEEEMQYGDYGRQRIFRGLGSNYADARRPERWRWKDGVFVLDDLAGDAPKRQRPLTAIEIKDLEYRLLIGMKRVLQNGGTIGADSLARDSVANRARRSTDGEINRVSLNDLYRATEALIDGGRALRVMVKNRCLLRPDDGPNYPDERPWVSL